MHHFDPFLTKGVIRDVRITLLPEKTGRQARLELPMPLISTIKDGALCRRTLTLSKQQAGQSIRSPRPWMCRWCTSRTLLPDKRSGPKLGQAAADSC